MERCDFCNVEAKYRVTGLANDGSGEGMVYSLACEYHKREFEMWDNGEEYLHGYAFVQKIERIAE